MSLSANNLIGEYTILGIAMAGVASIERGDYGE